jgi:photosystem II stability/assembly factor-like uncharacterized protein
VLSRAPIALLTIVGALAAGGCSDRVEPAGSGASAPAEREAGASLEHIHGLGVDPGDGRLFVATHDGLYSAAEGQTRVEQVGDVRQDIMGFSLVTADRFIGSGHPATTQELPPNLGLIESRDGGRTWESVSLLGEADFHVLRSSGSRVYGFDGMQGRLMVSSGGGRDWQRRSPPAALYDLAVDPADRDGIVASTERGMFASSDAGRRWRPLSSTLAGLLAWSQGGLYLVDGEGTVRRSKDAGRSFEAVGRVAGAPSALTAAGGELYVALADGTVIRSGDGGASWTVRARP